MTPEKIAEISKKLGIIYSELETEILVMIANHLKTNEDYSDDVFAWQAEKLNELSLINQETIKLLSEVTRLTEKEIEQIFDEVLIDTINTVDKQAEEAYEKAKRTGLIEAFIVLSLMESFKPLPVGNEYRELVERHKRTIFREFNVFINETLITTNLGQGAVAQMYRDIINRSASRAMTGEITIQKAVAKTVIEWSKRGVLTSFVDRGGRRWRLETYAETAIRSTINNLYNDVTIERMKEYGTDLVLVSSLPDPREACSHIQGKVASLSNPSSNPKYPSVYDFGYGEPWGLRGINCRHRFFPWFEGISENNQPQYSEEEMTQNRKLRQRQRYLERQIRQAKRELKLAEIIGDEETILAKKKLLRNRQARMREFINETGRTRQYERERVIV